MKLILTGGTGYIGGAALQRALTRPEITEVVVVSRRELDFQHPKLTTLIKKDFTTYSADDLAVLKGAKACVWALGKPGGSYDAKKLFPLAALTAFTERLAPAMPNGTKFRFVLVTGALTIADQQRWVPSALKGLQIVGNVQNQFAEYQKEHDNVLLAYIARPAMVHDATSYGSMLVPSSIRIPNPVLAAALVDIAINRNEKQLHLNTELDALGKKVLASDANQTHL